VFDRERIEGKLLHSSEGLKLAQRYFPLSIEKWTQENPRPAEIFSQNPELKCESCSKDLRDPKSHGIIVIWSKLREDYEEKELIEDIYWCCKGFCDDRLGGLRRKKGLSDGWEDIPDVMIPTVYLKWVMTVLNELHSEVTYSDRAFEKLKSFLLATYPFVARSPTTKEKERMRMLMMIPSYLGGMG
jgi:hypothetical protein